MHVIFIQIRDQLAVCCLLSEYAVKPEEEIVRGVGKNAGLQNHILEKSSGMDNKYMYWLRLA